MVQITKLGYIVGKLLEALEITKESHQRWKYWFQGPEAYALTHFHAVE